MMKKLLYFLKNFIIIAYILLIIFVTICLISYNDYRIAVIGDSTFLPVIDEDLEPDYSVGDLLIINRIVPSKVKVGDMIFFYRVKFGEATVNFAKVEEAEVITPTEVTFTIEGNYKFSSSNFIGKVDDVIIIPKVGKIMSVLESKWGFLFLGVFPSLLAFLYTLHSVVTEIIEVSDDDEPKKKKKKKKKNSDSTKEEVVNKEENEDKGQNTSTEVVSNEESKKEETISETKDEPKEDIEKKEIVEDNKEKEEINKPTASENNNIEENDKKENEKTENNAEVAKENTVNNEIEKNKEQQKQEEKTENTNVSSKEESNVQEDKKKAAIEAKMKSMTEEEKRALIKAKLDSMTEEEKRALIEAKKKKLEEEKNKKGEQ